MKSQLFIPVLLLTAVSASPQTQPKESPQPKGSTNAPNEWSLRGQLIANPHNREAHQKLCSIIEKRRDYRALVKERWAWLEDNSWDSSELISLETEAQVRLNDPQYAIEATERYLSRTKPDDSMYGWANNFLGRQLFSRDRSTKAVPLLQTAVEANPGFPDYWEVLGNALVRTGQIDAGIKALKKAIDLDSSSPSIHVSLGDAFAAKGDLENQEAEYIAACSLQKNNPLFSKERTNPSLSTQLTKLARIQIKHGKLREAAESLDKAIQADPQDVYAYLLRARVLELEGRVSEAAIQRKKAESIVADETRKEKKESSPFSTPLIWFVVDDEDEIIRILETQNERTVSDREILALAYWETGHKDEAVAELKTALKNLKLNTAFDNFSLAEALRKVELNQKAQEYYRKAYELDPENRTYRYEYEAIQKL
jgi:tetratricopeptide (TPR) repeat protein